MKTSKILTGIFVSALLGGCIKTDTSECSNDRYVCFESVMRKYDFRDIVDDTTLYLYDAENTLVFERTYTVEDLVKDNYRAHLPAREAGTYTLVASVNSGGDYHKKNPPEISGFEISLAASGSGSVTRKQADIYHGFRDIVFSEGNIGEEACDVVRLYKNTNHIHITLRYRGGGIPGANMPDARIEADNGAYDYRNRNIGGNDRTYEPHSRESGAGYDYFGFTVMHVTSGNTIVFGVDGRAEGGSSGTVLTMDLMAEIMKIYPTDDDLDQEDVFNIEIVLGEDLTVIELMVNGWYTIRDGVDI